MGADGLLKELAGAAALVQAQIAAGLSENDVKEMLARSFEARIDAHPPLQGADKSQLTTEITSGPWNAEQKILATAVLGNGSMKSKANASKRPNQKALNIENLIPTDTMVRLREPSKYSIASMLSLVASTAKALGIQNPDTATLFRMTAIVAAASETSMSQKEVWIHMNTIQKYVKTKARNSSEVEYVTVYPPTASLLPGDIQKSAYPDGILPPELDWPELDMVLGASKMKGARMAKNTGATNPKVQAANLLPTSPSASAPAVSSLMPSPDVFRFRADSRIMPLQGSFANGSFANAHQLAAQGKSELKCASENICNKCKGQLHDETDCPKQPDEDDEDDDEDEHEEEEPEHDSELDAFESGVIGALDTRGAMKKPAAKARAAAALAPMKAMKTAMKTMKLIKLKKVKPMKAMTAMKTMKKLMKKPSSTKKRFSWMEPREAYEKLSNRLLKMQK